MHKRQQNKWSEQTQLADSVETRIYIANTMVKFGPSEKNFQWTPVVQLIVKTQYWSLSRIIVNKNDNTASYKDSEAMQQNRTTRRQLLNNIFLLHQM